MPGFPWLEERRIDLELLVKKIGAMRLLGVPYESGVEDTIASLGEPTEMEALIAYLQMLGTLTKPTDLVEVRD